MRAKIGIGNDEFGADASTVYLVTQDASLAKKVAWVVGKDK
jgi:hypothetical protein